MAVIDLATKRQEREPHMQGRARCLACTHEWQAVATLGSLWLDCPACSLEKGRMVAPCMPASKLTWHCHCGNNLFVFNETGTLCPNCGVWQEF